MGVERVPVGRSARAALRQFAFVVGVLFVASGVVSAQVQDPRAPAGLACGGLLAPGDPPDTSGDWVLQWEWEWQRFDQSGSVSMPAGIAVDRNCNVYVADNQLNKIFKLSRSGETVATWGSPGKGPGQFDRLEGIAVDGLGNVYAADSGNDRVQKLSPNGDVTLIWASEFGCRGLSVKCQVVPDAFFGTVNVAADTAGNLYTVDAHSQIQKFGPDGGLLGKWGSGGSGPGQFNQARGISLDQAGFLYVADTLNNRIQKLTPDGKPVAQWPTAVVAFTQPRGVGVTLDGNVFVSDTDNDRVVKLGPDGAFAAQWARCVDDIDPCQSFVSGSAPGAFLLAYALAVDGRGEVFVADNGNNRVQVYKAIPVWVNPDGDVVRP